MLQRVKQERNILRKITRRNANWIGHLLRRNFLLNHVTEGKIEEWIGATRRRGKRSKQLLDGLNEIKKGNNRWHSVESSLWKRCLTCREGKSRVNGECECDFSVKETHRTGALHSYMKSDRSIADPVWKCVGPVYCSRMNTFCMVAINICIN